MIKKYIFKLLCLSIGLMGVVNGYGQDETIDSLYKAIKLLEGNEKLDAYNQLTRKMYSMPDSAFRINVINEFVAEAQKQKNIEMEGRARFMQVQFYFIWFNIPEFDKLYPDYMAFTKKHKLWKEYFDMFYFNIQGLCEQRKYDEALDETEKLLTFVKELNDPFGLGTVYNCFGNVYFVLARFDQAEESFYQAIDYFNQAKNAGNEMRAYLNLFRILRDQDRFEEAEKLLPDLENVRQRYVEELGFDDLPTRLYIHLQYLNVYANLEQYEKAKIYVNKIEEYIDDLPERYYSDFLVSQLYLYMAQEKYAQSLVVLDSLYQYNTRINHQHNILVCLSDRVICFAQLNRGKEAAETFKQYVELRETLEAEEINARLDEIRTQYEVEKITAEKERNHNYFLFALGGCLLLAIALGIWIHHSRTIVKKNRGLYRQIKEQDRLADELEALTKQYEQIAQLIPSATEEQVAAAEAEIAKLPGNKQQRQLVAHLRDFLLKDRYFANYDLDIQNLIPEMATNRTYLFEALKAVTGKTPMEYINYLRLDEAKRLLDNSNLTIETIAFDCGFNTSRTFYNQFRERYRMTPAAYRKMGVGSGI